MKQSTYPFPFLHKFLCVVALQFFYPPAKSNRHCKISYIILHGYLIKHDTLDSTTQYCYSAIWNPHILQKLQKSFTRKCDAIKQNELKLANIDLKIYPYKGDNFFVFHCFSNNSKCYFSRTNCPISMGFHKIKALIIP